MTLCLQQPYGDRDVFQVPEQRPGDLWDRLWHPPVQALLNIVEQPPQVVVTSSWLRLMGRAGFVGLFQRTGLGDVADALHAAWDAPQDHGCTRQQAIEKSVADVQLQREAGQAETGLRARLIHADAQVLIDAAVAGTISDDNRFEVVGDRDRVALMGWSRLKDQGQTSERGDNTAQTLDPLAALLDGQANYDLATIDEAASVVRCIESMLKA